MNILCKLYFLFLQENVTINGQSCANKMGTLIQTGCGYEKRFQGPIFQKRKVLAIIPPFTYTSSHTPSHIYIVITSHTQTKTLKTNKLID